MIINDPNKRQNLLNSLSKMMRENEILQYSDRDGSIREEGSVYEIPVDKETGLYSKEGTDTRRYLGKTGKDMSFDRSSIDPAYKLWNAAEKAHYTPQDSLSSIGLDSLINLIKQPEAYPYGHQKNKENEWEEIVKMIEPVKKGLGLFGRRKK